jgi:ADP-heptose:LPS heptosyltransferase
MQQENSWDNKKTEILKILANVFLKDPSVEGIALTPGSETEKKVSLYLAGLGIELEPGSEVEKAMKKYIAGQANKYSEYQSRLSFWAPSVCLGDTICTTPTLRKIKELYSNYPIDVYSLYPDIFRYNKNADTVIVYDPKLERDGYYSELRNFGYKQNFLSGYVSEPKTEINLKTTNLIDSCSIKVLNIILEDSEKNLEVPVSKYEEQSLLGKIDAYRIDFNKAVIIHPSKTWITRTWPEENWKKLTDNLRENGFQVIAVGKTAPVSDERLKAKGNENYGMQPCPEGAINLIDSLSILETAYLLSLCKFVITMDSGLLHLALSTDINIIAMFTVIDPQFRKAWRHGSFDYKLQVVPPNGDCYYCSNLKQDIVEKGQSYTQCPLGLNMQCFPTVEAVLRLVLKQESSTTGEG